MLLIHRCADKFPFQQQTEKKEKRKCLANINTVLYVHRSNAIFTYTLCTVFFFHFCPQIIMCRHTHTRLYCIYCACADIARKLFLTRAAQLRTTYIYTQMDNSKTSIVQLNRNIFTLFSIFDDEKTFLKHSGDIDLFDKTTKCWQWL